jgi:hypothetical protein
MVKPNHACNGNWTLIKSYDSQGTETLSNGESNRPVYFTPIPTTYNKKDLKSHLLAGLNRLKRAFSTLVPKCFFAYGRGVKSLSQILLHNHLIEMHAELKCDLKGLSCEDKGTILSSLKNIKADHKIKKYLDSKLGLSERILFDDMCLLLTDDLKERGGIIEESCTHVAKLFASCSGSKGCAYLNSQIMRVSNYESYSMEIIKNLSKKFTQYFTSCKTKSLKDNSETVDNKVIQAIKDDYQSLASILRSSLIHRKKTGIETASMVSKDLLDEALNGKIRDLFECDLRKFNAIDKLFPSTYKHVKNILDHKTNKTIGYRIEMLDSKGKSVDGRCQIIRESSKINPNVQNNHYGNTSYVSHRGVAEQQKSWVMEFTESELYLSALTLGKSKVITDERYKAILEKIELGTSTNETLEAVLATRKSGLYIIRMQDETKQRYYQVTRDLEPCGEDKSNRKKMLAQDGAKMLTRRKLIRLNETENSKIASLIENKEKWSGLISEKILCDSFENYEPTHFLDSIGLSLRRSNNSQQVRMSPNIDRILSTNPNFSKIFLIDFEVSDGIRRIRSAGHVLSDLLVLQHHNRAQMIFHKLDHFAALTPLAKAIDRLAAMKIVLRDLKPNNMGLGSDGIVKVFDLQDSGYAGQFSHIMGTPGYCNIRVAKYDYNNVELAIKNMYLSYLVTEIELFSGISSPDINGRGYESEDNFKKLSKKERIDIMRWMQAINGYCNLRVKPEHRDSVKSFLFDIDSANIGKLADILVLPKDEKRADIIKLMCSFDEK